MYNIKGINFGCDCLVMPWGLHLGVSRGKKVFQNIAMWHIKSKGMMSGISNN